MDTAYLRGTLVDVESNKCIHQFVLEIYEFFSSILCANITVTQITMLALQYYSHNFYAAYPHIYISKKKDKKKKRKHLHFQTKS